MHFYFPLQKAYLTQGFTVVHTAIDLGWWRIGLIDPPVYSVGDGVVIASYYDTGGGNIIAILDKETSDAHWYQARYVHLKSRSVRVGDSVKRGQVIGMGNNTGTNSTGAHLHLELLIVPFGYDKFVYRDRLLYAIDPRTVVFIEKNQAVTGEGVRFMEITNAKNPMAIPYSDKLRMRSSPSAASLLNIIDYVPMTGLVLLGVTNEIEKMFWAKMLLDTDKVVWAAMSMADGSKNYMYIKEEHTIQYVEVLVPTVKPLNSITFVDDAEIRVQVLPISK